MNEAVFGLIGVIVGSLITYFGQYISSKSEYKKWRKEKRIEVLRLRKRDLEEKYEKYDIEIIKALESPTFDAKMGMDVLINFPENVEESFSQAIKAKVKRSQKEKSKDYQSILLEMKKSLLAIDREINKEINEE